MDFYLYHSGFSSVHCNNVKKYCVPYTNLWIILVKHVDKSIYIVQKQY